MNSTVLTIFKIFTGCWNGQVEYCTKCWLTFKPDRDLILGSMVSISLSLSISLSHKHTLSLFLSNRISLSLSLACSPQTFSLSSSHLHVLFLLLLLLLKSGVRHNNYRIPELVGLYYYEHDAVSFIRFVNLSFRQTPPSEKNGF